MITDRSLYFVILTTLMTMLVLLASDMYLPALPLIKHSFGANETSVQMTLSSFFFGAALAQLVIGPLVDKYGIRLMGLISILLFIIASIFCAASHTLYQLIVSRFFEACDAGFAAVIARVAVTNYYDKEKAAHVFLIIGTLLAVSPAVAPAMGGNITKYFGWRSVFIFIALISCIIYFIAFKVLSTPSNKTIHKKSIHPIQILRLYSEMLHHRLFFAYLSARCAVDAAYFGYITASPFIFAKLGHTPAEIGNFYIPTIVTFVSTAYLTKKIMNDHNKPFLMMLGLVISICGAILMLLAAVSGYCNAFAIIAPTSIMTAGYGFTGSLSWSEAMAQFPEKAGSASSLIGFFPLVAAAISAAIVHFITHGSVAILAVYMLALLVGGLFPIYSVYILE